MFSFVPLSLFYITKYHHIVCMIYSQSTTEHKGNTGTCQESILPANPRGRELGIIYCPYLYTFQQAMTCRTISRFPDGFKQTVSYHYTLKFSLLFYSFLPFSSYFHGQTSPITAPCNKYLSKSISNSLGHNDVVIIHLLLEPAQTIHTQARTHAGNIIFKYSHQWCVIGRPNRLTGFLDRCK